MGQDTSEKERYRSGHNGADSKSDGGLRPTWVRIPPSPPFTRVAGKWLIISMRTEGSTRFAGSESERREAAAQSAKCMDARSNPAVHGCTNAAEAGCRERPLSPPFNQKLWSPFSE